MRYVDLGGARISVIGLGAWQFGSREWGYGNEYARREAAAITRRALDLGINLIDTAEIYGYGRSERIVGGAIAGRRDEVFLATKLYPAFPIGPAVVRQAQGSIRRLGVDRLDLYQVHALNPIISVRSTMRGMTTLRAQGRIQHVGVSNFPLSAWQAAEDALGGPVLSNQVRYSLAVRDAERELLPWAQANDRLIIAYSPLAQGLLSGRYDGTNTPADVRARNPLFLPKSMSAAEELLRALQEIAESHAASAAQVALAWLIRRPNVVVIPGARTVAQVEENAAAADLALDDDEDRRLTEVSGRFRPAAGKADVRRHRLRALVRR